MHKTVRRFTQALPLLALTCAISFDGLAQEASRPDRGLTPNGSFSVSDIENVNLLNGNVNVKIPLASLPPVAGGKLSWTVTAQYNSKIWDMVRHQENSDPMTWAPYIVDTAGTGGGWTIGGQYVMVFRNANDDMQRLWYPGNSGLPQWDLNLINNFQWWKVVLRLPDGSEHEFRPLDNSSYNGSRDFLRGFFNVIPNGSAAKCYYSVDGTFMFARITNWNDWAVYMLDGTQVIQTSDGIQRIQDTNGNKIKIFSDSNGTHYQDEHTNREIRVAYSASTNTYQVWYDTVGGIDQHIDVVMGSTTVEGKLYPVNVNGCELTEVLSAHLEVVREIVFPQTELGQLQRKFTFSYNSDTSTVATDPAAFSCPGGGQNYAR